MAKQSSSYTLPDSLVASLNRIAKRKGVSRSALIVCAIDQASLVEHLELPEDQCSITAGRERDNGKLLGGDRMRAIAVKMDSETVAKLATMAEKYTHGNCSLMLRRACQSLVDGDSNAVVVL